MKKALFIGDAAVSTGFASVNHNIITHISKRWDIHTLAINYRGDYHSISEHTKLYSPTARIPTDVYGLLRIAQLATDINPNIIFINNDSWVICQYLEKLKETNTPIVAYTPVDTDTLPIKYVNPLHKLSRLIVPTQFAKATLEKSGYKDKIDIIPHGIDLTHFTAIDKEAAKKKAGFNPDWFIVQAVDRNSIRKRIDLALYAFSIWVKDKPNNIKFYYHGDLNDEGYDIIELARQFGISDRLLVTDRNLKASEGIPIEAMKYVYSLADIKVSTSGGEGWGLTTMESMACKTANIAVDIAAIPEWSNGTVYLVPEDTHIPPNFTPKQLTTRHGVVDISALVTAFETLYTNHTLRNEYAQKGYERVRDPMFKWPTVAKQFETIFSGVIK